MRPICHFAYSSTTRYWYHPDHLGSASWVSDKAGKGIQHLYYLPWGEELDNQRATDYASRYTFSGKERDEETGYSYFGARYYHSALSLWLSVDPLADKYPGVSPYTYCANNPVRLVDPDGREWLDPEKDGKIAGELIYRAKQAICRHEKSIQKFQKWADKATDPKQKNDLEKGIADHKQRIDLLTEAIAGITEMGNKEGVYFHYNVNAKRTTHNVQLIRANDDNKHDYISINVKDSYIIQMHETVHAFDYMQGKYCLEFSNNGLLGSRYYHDESEIHAYQVEYSLSSTKERFPNIVHVQDINKKTIKSIEDAAPNSP